MLFNLFGSNKKQEFIDGYAQKLADAAVEGEIDADLLEELIDYAREHDLSNKELASAQALACDKVTSKSTTNYFTNNIIFVFSRTGTWMMTSMTSTRISSIPATC